MADLTSKSELTKESGTPLESSSAEQSGAASLFEIVTEKRDTNPLTTTKPTDETRTETPAKTQELLDGTNSFELVDKTTKPGGKAETNHKEVSSDEGGDTKSVLPQLDLHQEVDENPTLTNTERARVSYLQEQLRVVYPLAFSGPREMSDEDKKRAIEVDIEALDTEIKEGKFGKATEKAYETVVTWLEKQAIPGAIKELSRLSVPLPTGAPIDLPIESDRVISGDYFRAMIDAGRLTPDLSLDTSKIPQDIDLDTIDDTMSWIKKSDDLAREVRHQRQDQLLEEQIKKIIIDPQQQEAWLDRKNSKPEEWRAAAIEAIDLATRVKNYVEAMDSLHRAGKRFPIELPPGCEVERDGEGRISHVSLDLPSDLRLAHPTNHRKLELMRGWLNDHGESIDQAIKELIDLEKNPDRLLFWGEIEMPHGLAKTDEAGNITEFVAPEKADGSEQEFNLAQLRFDVEETVGDDGKKKIVVSNNVQYERSDWYNYLNIGAEDIGNRINVEKREYAPEDWIAIRNGSNVEMIQAKDLSSWKNYQMGFHYAEKGVIASLDAAMLVTGTIEVGAAVKAARAGELVMSQAIKQGLKGSLRAAVGLSGVVNNAYFMETEYGQNLQMARGLYFVGDAALGLGQSGWRWAQSLRGVESTGQSAAKIVNAQIKASRWATTYKIGETTASLTAIPFSYMIYRDIWSQVDALEQMRRADPITSAIRQGIDGRGDHLPEGDQSEPLAIPVDTSAALKPYSYLFQEGSKVREIIDRASELSMKESSENERKEFLEGLMDEFRPSGEEIKRLELDGKYARSKNNEFLDISESRNRATQTAAAIAIVHLTRTESGELPQVLIERAVTVPAYDEEISSFNPLTESTDKSIRHREARSENQKLEANDVIAFLRRDLEQRRVDSAPVASGDLALQMGCASGIEFAALLGDIIEDETASTSLKVQSVIRLGAIADALKIQELTPRAAEEQFKSDAKRVGVSSEAIVESLRDLAKSDENKDVRMVAALMNHANSEPTQERRQELLRQYSLSLGASDLGSDKYFAYGKKVLAEKMNARDITQQRRFEAATALLDTLDDSETGLKFDIYKNLSELITSKDVALAVKSLEVLTPKGLEVLERGHPDLARDLRNNALNIVRDTQHQIREMTLDKSGEESRAKFIRILPRLIEGSPEPLQRSQMASLLEDLIDPSSGNYADISPPLRESAVTALSELGSRGAATTLKNLLRGSKENGVEREPNAAVRLEALKALDSMNDEDLQSIVMDLLKVERDPRVSAELREIQFDLKRPDPTSEEYRESFEKTAAALMRDPFEGWGSLKQEIDQYKTYLPAGEKQQAIQKYVRQWRNDRFWMLDSVEYNRFKTEEGDRAAHGVYAGFEGFAEWMTESRKTVREKENAARNERIASIDKRRDAQFQDLIDTADRTNLDGMKAKMALVDVLVNGGQPFAAGESEWAQRESAKALRDLCAPGVENRDYVAWAIQLGLTTGPAMDKQARGFLLDGLKTLASPDENGRVAISREEAALTIASALELENNLRSPYQADETLQIELVKALGTFKHHKAFPVLEAISKERSDSPLGYQASLVMGDFRDSVSLVWNDTKPDRTATAAMGAERIENSLRGNASIDSIVENIFVATRGKDLAGTNDPRLPILEIALNDGNEKVRLAAAMALSMDSLGAKLLEEKITRTLKEISESGSREAYKKEASLILERLNK